MSQAGDNNTSGTMPTIFAATKVEQGGSTSEPNTSAEALGLLSNAAARELPITPNSSHEATVITPRADGKGGVIDLAAIRREQQVMQMQNELLTSLRSEAALEEPVPVAAPRQDLSIQAQIEARTAEIRQIKRQAALPVATAEASAQQPQEQSGAVDILGAIQRLLPKSKQPLDLYTARQTKKAA